jgi:hypothetical protein
MLSFVRFPTVPQQVLGLAHTLVFDEAVEDAPHVLRRVSAHPEQGFHFFEYHCRLYDRRSAVLIHAGMSLHPLDASERFGCYGYGLANYYLGFHGIVVPYCVVRPPAEEA